MNLGKVSESYWEKERIGERRERIEGGRQGRGVRKEEGEN